MRPLRFLGLRFPSANQPPWHHPTIRHSASRNPNSLPTGGRGNPSRVRYRLNFLLNQRSKSASFYGNGEVKSFLPSAKLTDGWVAGGSPAKVKGGRRHLTCSGSRAIAGRPIYMGDAGEADKGEMGAGKDTAPVARQEVCRQTPGVGAVCVNAHIRTCAGEGWGETCLPTLHKTSVLYGFHYASSSFYTALFIYLALRQLTVIVFCYVREWVVTIVAYCEKHQFLRR